jgi:hypothetical protein
MLTIWIADSNSNASTIYDGTGAELAPIVSIESGANESYRPAAAGRNSPRLRMARTDAACKRSAIDASRRRPRAIHRNW